MRLPGLGDFPSRQLSGDDDFLGKIHLLTLLAAACRLDLGNRMQRTDDYFHSCIQLYDYFDTKQKHNTAPLIRTNEFLVNFCSKSIR